jgi:hypothetical protein
VRWLWVILVSAGFATDAYAFNQDGQYDDVPDNIRQWFQNQRSPQGMPCCSVADGHPTEDDIRGNSYYVPNPMDQDGPWIKVPPEAVIYGSKNPTGTAIVWYVIYNGTTIYIRCFVPGAAL